VALLLARWKVPYGQNIVKALGYILEILDFIDDLSPSFAADYLQSAVNLLEEIITKVEDGTIEVADDVRDRILALYAKAKGALEAARKRLND